MMGSHMNFIKYFLNELKEMFVDCFNYSYNKIEMSPSQRQAVITLIDKKDKDRQYLKNRRTISLLNTDYKIASKSIAFRLKRVLSKLVSFDQSGFVDNRNISFALRTVLDIIEITKRENKNGLLMLIDFEKAFDNVNHNFLFAVLEKFNFSLSFRNWIKTFYSNI